MSETSTPPAPIIQPTWGSKPVPTKPVVHSWSSLNAFEQCAWRWYQTKIAKAVTESQSEEMREGNEHHKALELAVRDGLPLPDKYAPDAPIVEMIRKSPGLKLTEWQFGLTKDWTETTFFAKDVWLRGKIDVAVIGTRSAFAGDYKTGKIKNEYDQLGMFVIPMFVRYPYLESIKSAYIWLGNNKTDPKTYVQADLPHLKAKFAFRIQRIEDAVKQNRFPKMPSGLCKQHCPVPRSLCEYQGRMI